MAHEASFREAFDDFIEDKLYQGASPATIHFYRSNVEPFLRDTGITSLEDLRLLTIRHWLFDHSDLSENPLATYDRCRRVVCNSLERRGDVDERPMRQLLMDRPPRPRDSACAAAHVRRGASVAPKRLPVARAVRHRQVRTERRSRVP